MSVEDNPYVGPYVMNYYVDLPKKQCVVQTSDGNYRFPLPKRKDGYALEQMLLTACMEHNLDYCSEDWLKVLVQNAVDSFWIAMRAKNAPIKLEAIA